MEAQEIITAEAGTVALLNKSEIDMQVATAHKYPRSVKRFRDETLATCMSISLLLSRATVPASAVMISWASM